MTAEQCTQIVKAIEADGGWDQWQKHGDDQCSVTARWTGGDPLSAARVLVGKLGLEIEVKDVGHGVVRLT